MKLFEETTFWNKLYILWGMKMSFKDFAFKDVLDELSRHPSDNLTLLVTIDREDYETLPEQGDLQLSPSYSGQTIRNLSKDEIERRMPVVLDMLEEGGEATGAVLQSGVLLPALFATVGHAVCADKRNISLFLQVPGDIPRALNIHPNSFAHHEQNIRHGARTFYKNLFGMSGNPPQLRLFVVFNAVNPH